MRPGLLAELGASLDRMGTDVRGKACGQDVRDDAPGDLPPGGAEFERRLAGLFAALSGPGGNRRQTIMQLKDMARARCVRVSLRMLV